MQPVSDAPVTPSYPMADPKCRRSDLSAKKQKNLVLYKSYAQRLNRGIHASKSPGPEADRNQNSDLKAVKDAMLQTNLHFLMSKPTVSDEQLLQLQSNRFQRPLSNDCARFKRSLPQAQMIPKYSSGILHREDSNSIERSTTTNDFAARREAEIKRRQSLYLHSNTSTANHMARD